MRRSLIVFAVAALMAATAAPAAARPLGSPLTVTPLTATRMIQANKSVSGQLARSDADLLARRDRAVVNVMVKMDVDALASYAGDVAGFRATSPGVTGRTLNDNSGAVGSYQRYLEGKAFGIRRAAQRVVPGMRLGRNFLVAFGGFAAQLPANRARDLLKVKGVAAVQYDTVSYPTANDSPDFVGATALWPSLGGSATAGEGIKVGVIDTGIWPEHPMLLDPGIDAPPGGPYGCEFGDGIDPDFGDDFTCNDKMLGAYAFLETNLFVSDAADGNFCNDANTECSARDPDGHGTHTSTTAVGSHVASAVLYGVERGPISGIAPGASLIHYRVCLDGCYSSDSIDAVEQAILDDVDVINFSISGGANPYSDSVELAFLDAYAAGILVNASAGNDGPDAGTANHGGPWVNTVGASTLDREFGSMVSLVADNLDTLDVSGVTITAGVTSAPVVLGSATTSGEICDTPAGGGDYTGVVVVCKRGGIARVEKGYNISLGGAAGMILYNTTATDLETDNHWVPAIHVNDPSETIAAFVAGHTGVMATWSAGVAGPTLGDMMASFSSRGPLGDFIKPDVTAPGVQILAGNSPDLLFDPAGGLGPDGELYQAIAGTSMSSPHAAGVAALLKDAHPSWTPGQIKSAMMTSSRQSVVKEDGSTPADPFDMGAGSIRANRANTPTVTFDVSAAQYFASAGDPFSRIHLNTPSINAPTMSGKITTTRTVQNATGVAQTLNASATAPAGSTITVTPSSISLTPWGFATFSVTIDGQKLADGQYFGLITLDPVAGAYRNAVLPVAFYKQPGDVTLENSCDTPPTLVADEETILKGDELDCEVTVTNYASADAHVQVRVRAPNTGRLIVNDWSAGNKKGNGFLWNGTLSPALAPDILSIDAPGYGYWSLPSLGVPPEAGYGDETIGIYEGLTPFTFGGEVYDSLGIDSNGYVVLGGGLGVEDNNCCDPLMPDPARPNNVLAPYWTDLDPSTGGDIYFAELDFGGGFVYHVIEWRKVPVWGTSDERTFQVWIAATTAPEDIAFEYCIAPNDDAYPTSFGCDDAAPGTLGLGASDGLVVGAENRDGTSAATIGPEDTEPSNSGYVVDAGEPTAGGTYTIMYQAWGKKTGTFLMRALMTSDVTQGTAIQIVKVHVVNP